MSGTAKINENICNDKYAWRPYWALTTMITGSSSLQVYMLADVARLLQSHLLIRTNFTQIQFCNITFVQSGHRL